jgi:hypothetical protein
MRAWHAADLITEPDSSSMSDQTRSDSSKPAPPASAAVEPRTHVNSAMTVPYVPSKSVPVRAGADDHKRHATKGLPT